MSSMATYNALIIVAVTFSARMHQMHIRNETNTCREEMTKAAFDLHKETALKEIRTEFHVLYNIKRLS